MKWKSRVWINLISFDWLFLILTSAIPGNESYKTITDTFYTKLSKSISPLRNFEQSFSTLPSASQIMRLVFLFHVHVYNHQRTFLLQISGIDILSFNQWYGINSQHVTIINKTVLKSLLVWELLVYTVYTK